MNNYYSIEDIITDGQKLPCNFEITVPGLGYLHGDVGGDINENTKLELPLWLAELLAISGISPESQTSFISLLSPSFFSPKVMNALKSDPVNLDMVTQCPVYYRMAQRWLSIFGDSELTEVVSETLRARAVEIFDHAHNINANGSEFLFKLDEFEKRLYKQSHDSSKELKKWLRNQTNS